MYYWTVGFLLILFCHKNEEKRHNQHLLVFFKISHIYYLIENT